eukprot:scaffold178671_cov68-Attheya_sp.AAC.3
MGQHALGCMAQGSGSPIGRGIRKSVVDSTAGSGDNTITADCGRGQGWGTADEEGGYRTTDRIRDDVACIARHTRILHAYAPHMTGDVQTRHCDAASYSNKIVSRFSSETSPMHKKLDLANSARSADLSTGSVSGF